MTPPAEAAERIYQATVLVGRSDLEIMLPDYRVEAPFARPGTSPLGDFEPEFPADGSEIDRICWYAGVMQHQFNCSIDVVVNPNDSEFGPQPGWYQFRFNTTDFLRLDGKPLDSYTWAIPVYVGRNDAEVAAFLAGITTGHMWTRWKEVGPLREPLNDPEIEEHGD